MPYKNILWLKLEKRLLNDYRLYSMKESSQLIFFKLLLIAAQTDNKIPKKPLILRSTLRSTLEPTEIEKAIKEIKTNFPKFKEGKHYYHFIEWNTRHNRVALGNSQGTPQDAVDKIRIDKIIEEYIRVKGWDEAVQKNKSLLSDIYKRNCRTAKQLALVIRDTGQACEFIRNISKQFKANNLSWTLETIVKHLPEEIAKKQPAKKPIKKPEPPKKAPERPKISTAEAEKVKELVKGVTDKCSA